MLVLSRRRIVGLAILALGGVVVGAPTPAAAQDLQQAYRDLATGADFRVRLAAALTIGKSGHPGARPALEKALEDPHPAVRAGAAAGLGAVGDPGAITALRAAGARESTASVKSQIETTIARLSTGARTGGGKTKFLVALGRMDNRSGVTTPALASALKTTTRNKLSQIPGVELLADGADATGESKRRGAPVFLLDGTLTQLNKSQRDSDVAYAARVEYMIRRAPEHSLKGTMTGRAEALADARSVRGASEIAQLQLDAVAAAIDSALKGAPPALEAAAKT